MAIHNFVFGVNVRHYSEFMDNKTVNRRTNTLTSHQKDQSAILAFFTFMAVSMRNAPMQNQYKEFIFFFINYTGNGCLSEARRVV